MKNKIIILLLVIFTIIPLRLMAAEKPIIVSSKIDTEGALLGNMIYYALKYNGLNVKNKTGLGATNILRRAIKSGEIDIYPEYTGNGAYFFPYLDKTIFKNFKKGYEAVKKEDLKKNSIVWLTPANANNTWALATRKSFAQKNKIYSLEDFAKYVNNGGFVKLACSEEFATRKDALPAFEKAYGFKLKRSQLIILSGGNTTQTEKALARKINNVNFAMAYGTDGSLSALNLIVLKDTKHIEPIYAPTPIIRKQTLDKHPEIAKILKPIFKSLTTETLQALNAKIAIEGIPAAFVAKDYLKNKGFIK
ncbi:glycine betaine ABC transporter substrate-binding protein OsmF [Hippea maritima]|uniref:ABC-type glycine betaine transport, periplasmic subunit n=1 Tax=Hippea maritima (strain ATCC 700847 / DSM 10411 / MH2) TaxID=760142 RepID=F2LVC9_HIPMA|nr:ABC transporter substrate-binding protein [Hippea maritima]AEA33713.1 ABC-type glycine betaine transport, periplasmic subunit [Hippea maritima DSM 10411]